MTYTLDPRGGYTISKIHLVGHTYNNVRLYAPGTYSNERLALVLDAEEGDRLTTVTVNIPEAEPALGCVLVKTWSENEGLLPQLSGILHPTGGDVMVGYPSYGASAAEAQILVTVDSLKGV